MLHVERNIRTLSCSHPVNIRLQKGFCTQYLFPRSEVPSHTKCLQQLDHHPSSCSSHCWRSGSNRRRWFRPCRNCSSNPVRPSASRFQFRPRRKFGWNTRRRVSNSYALFSDSWHVMCLFCPHRASLAGHVMPKCFRMLTSLLPTLVLGRCEMFELN